MVKIKLMAELCVLAVAAYLFAQATVPLLAGSAVGPGVHVSSEAAKAPARQKKQPLAAYKAIAGRNLFAAKVSPPKPKPKSSKADAKPKDLPVSSAGVQLLGTIYSTSPEFSRAIIFVGGKQFLYKIGDKAHGLEFRDIRRRAVLVAMGAKEELLVIDSKDVNTAKESFKVQRFSSDQLLKYLSDAEGLSRDVGVAPRRQGQYRGMAITRLSRGSLLEQAGLRQDDLVLDANGRPIHGPSDMMRLGRDIRQGKLSLGVLRQGQPITLNIQLDAQ